MSNTKRFLAVLSVAAALIALTLPASAQSGYVGDGRIVPGERIGNIKLGMSVSEIAAILGEPPGAGGMVNSPNKVIYNYGPVELYVSGDKVYEIQSNSTALSLANGLTVGSSDFEVRAKEGTPACARSYGNGLMLRLSYQGLFFFLQHSKVINVYVGKGAKCN